MYIHIYEGKHEQERWHGHEHKHKHEHEHGHGHECKTILKMVMMRWWRGNMCLHELRGSVVDWSMNNDEYRTTGLEDMNMEMNRKMRRMMFWMNWWLLRTTRLPMTTVARKKGTQTFEATHLQTNYEILSILQISIVQRFLWFQQMCNTEDRYECRFKSKTQV